MASELKRKLDYSDLQVTPDDGRRHELVHGELLVTPSPGYLHQRVSKRLLLVLVDYFESRSLGEVLHAPTDVILTNQDVFVPDLLVVADPTHISARGIEGPPLLIVEILSPSTANRDRGLKSRRYAEFGVEHFWIVDPESRRFECHRLRESAYRAVVTVEGDATVTHPEFADLGIELSGLWC